MARKSKAEKQIDEWVRRLEKQTSDAGPKIVAVLNDEAERILAAALPEWPVKTGDSKDGLRIEVTVKGDKVKVSLKNDVPYVYYIKAKNLNKKAPFQTLIQRPGRKSAKQLAAALVRLMKEEHDG